MIRYPDLTTSKGACAELHHTTTRIIPIVKKGGGDEDYWMFSEQSLEIDRRSIMYVDNCSSIPIVFDREAALSRKIHKKY